MLQEEIKAADCDSLEEFLQLQHALIESYKPSESIGFQSTKDRIPTAVEIDLARGLHNGSLKENKLLSTPVRSELS